VQLADSDHGGSLHLLQPACPIRSTVYAHGPRRPGALPVPRGFRLIRLTERVANASGPAASCERSSRWPARGEEAHPGTMGGGRWCAAGYSGVSAGLFPANDLPSHTGAPRSGSSASQRFLSPGREPEPGACAGCSKAGQLLRKHCREECLRLRAPGFLRAGPFQEA
jgi:hypothetical protein